VGDGAKRTVTADILVPVEISVRSDALAISAARRAFHRVCSNTLKPGAEALILKVVCLYRSVK
jgi:hypothetical protein